MIEITELLMTTILPTLPKAFQKRKNSNARLNSSLKERAESILYIGKNFETYQSSFNGHAVNFLTAKSCLIAFYRLEKLASDFPDELPSVLVCDHELLKEGDYSLIAHIRCHSKLHTLPLIVIGEHLTLTHKNKLIENGIIEFYDLSNEVLQFQNRLRFFQNSKTLSIKQWDYSKDNRLKYKTNFFKRIFDIVFASAILIALSPLLLLIALIIKLESKGPLFYISKRAGAAYKIFNFYKFRTMVPDAEEKLVQLKEKNQYQTTSLDPEFYFVKIKNDPRITYFGRFLRNTSLDELPQLLNVIKGDMSIIGNRPLPLYEAEQLKRDKWAKRFLAPAGITGLWQIKKRGGNNMSALQRVALDILYAEQNSLWLDVKIFFLTFPAMLQKESV